MSGGREYSSYQRGIIDRYYQNIDTITIGKLGEMVSELYVCTDAKKAATHWKNVQLALKKTPADPLKVGRIVGSRDVKQLAELVNQLSTMKPEDMKKAAAVSPPPPSPSSPPPAPTAQPAAPSASETAPQPQAAPASAPASATTIAQLAQREPTSPEVLKAAMTSFKKRLKLTRLDAESKLSARALTGGRQSGIVGILPPREFPRETWDELVKQGRLKGKGDGFYEMP